MPTHSRFGKMLLVLALMLLVLPSAARAVTVTLVPEQFVAMNGTDSAAIDPWAMTSGDAGPAQFTRTVALPVGATIGRLIYYHWGNGTASTNVALYRTKMGLGFNPAAGDMLMMTTSNASYPVTAAPQIVSTTAPATPASDLVVRRGYRYFLVVACNGNGGWVNGVKIVYAR